MKRKCLSILAFFFVFSFFSVAFAFSQKTPEAQKQADFEAKYPTTSIDYRGVVAVDMDEDGDDDLICDFGSLGVWYYRQGTGWTKINNNNPDWLISYDWASSHYILADFGSLGLWQGYWAGGDVISWIKENNNNASFAFSLDDDMDGNDEVYVDFGGLGLWRRDWSDFSWTKINNASPGDGFKSDMWDSGWHEGVFDFGGTGLWSTYHEKEGGADQQFWDKLNASEPGSDNLAAELGIGDSTDELVIDFMPSLWLLDPDEGLWPGTWHKLTHHDTYDIREVRFENDGSDYEFLAHFGTVSGLWRWNYPGSYPGTWTKINNNNPDYDEAFCEPFDPNGLSESGNDEEVAVDFGGLGLWLYDNTGGSWTKINNNSPQFMIRADLFKDGKKVCLVCDFGTLGLWYYDGFLNIWTKINNNSPDPS